MVRDRHKDLKSSMHINEFTPINFGSILSPHGGASKNSGMHGIRAFKNIPNAAVLVKWLYLLLSRGASNNSDVLCIGYVRIF